MSKPYVDAGPCAVCGCAVLIPEALKEAAKHSSKISFYCPYGHSLHYPDTEKKIEAPPPTSKILQLIKGSDK